MKWLKENSILRKEKRFSIALFKELIDTYNGCSETVNKKDCLHRLVESNRAFSFFSF